MNGWKVWVRTYGEKTWATNSVVFKTKEEAEEWGRGLFLRWTAVEEWEAREEKPKVEAVNAPEKGVKDACLL